MNNILIPVAVLLLSLTSTASFSDNNNGITIDDKEPYPLYKYSRISDSEKTPSIILLESPTQDADASVTTTNILKTIGVPFQVISESPAIYQTDWISWHYDVDSKKTLSSINNAFFSLNTRDKYKFKITISTAEQQNAPVQSTLTFENILRQQQHDITPDTEMVWLKWKDEKPDKNAIKAFMQRIQTEYEIIALSSIVLTSNKQPAATNLSNKIQSNSISLDLEVDQAWATLIKRLKEQSISLSTVNSEQHILSTKWIHNNYATITQNADTTDQSVQRHQFQLLVVPGASAQTSTLFVYHTAYQTSNKQKNLNDNSWSEQTTQKNIASTFLNTIKIDE
jgi:hypothetical protein